MNTHGSRTLAEVLKTVDHQETADKLGVTRACLYTWRRGRGTPNRNNRMALERLFGIPPTHWFIPVDALMITEGV
jgi:hypothetical protein